MSSATGSFDSVNVTSEADNGNPDIYSLQLNSSYFSSPAVGAGAGGGAGEIARIELERVDVGITVVGLARHVDAVERPCGRGHHAGHLGLEIDAAAHALKS